MSNFNKELGLKIKKVRIMRKLSQTDLAKAIGISFQQIQKYESGKDRVSVERLKDICKALKVDYLTFIDAERGLPLLNKKEVQLVMYTRKIKCVKTKNALVEMAKTIGGVA